MGFAGIWAAWWNDTQRIISCAILTVAANDTVRPLHNRMPAILPPDCYNDWLNPDTDPADLHRMMTPFPPELMEVSESDTLVNSPRNEGPELLNPAA